MGDRFFQPRHSNIALLLQRAASVTAWTLPGIGHNGGPPLDLSGPAWIWRRAVAKAWATPPREIALQRLRRAERLGLSYRDLASALLDTGSYLSVALLPLHHLCEMTIARDGRIDLHDDGAVAQHLQRFDGRLFVVLDAAFTGPLDRGLLRRLEASLRERYGDRIEGLLHLPFRLDRSDAQRAAAFRRRLRSRGIHRKECFWLGSAASELRLAQAAGLGYFKPLAGWFLAG